MITKYTRLAAAASLAALLTACGGGGNETSTSGSTAPIPSTPSTTFSATLTEFPMVGLSPGQNGYPLGSVEAETFDRVNRARTECGFGALTQDMRLDKSAAGHGKYLIAENAEGHYQPNSASLFFSGFSPEDRMSATGYRDAFGSNARVSEGIGYAFSAGEMNYSHGVYNIMNAPYHALDMLAPRQHIGISLATAATTGVPNQFAAFGYERTALVFNYGARVENNRALIQALPSDEVLTYPCSASTGRILNAFGGEAPDPFNNQRNYHANPVGSPFMVVARHGSGLRVTSAKLTHIATGKVVPLMDARHSDTDYYPGSSQVWSHADLMDWAIIFPNERLEVGKYRMEISTTVNGKTIGKVVEFTTTDTLR